MLSSLCEVLSAISAISAGHYYLMRIVALLSQRNKHLRSKGKRYFTALFMGGVRTIQVLRSGGFMDANMNGLLV